MSSLRNEPNSKTRVPRQSGLDKLKAALLNAVVPIGMRRAIFAVSLVARLKKLSTPDRELAKRVGILMDLTCNPESLLYPMQINGWIWKDLTVGDIDLTGKNRLTGEELHTFCTNIVRSTPSVLRYSTNRDMRDDVYRLIMAFTPATATRLGQCE